MSSSEQGSSWLTGVRQAFNEYYYGPDHLDRIAERVADSATAALCRPDSSFFEETIENETQIEWGVFDWGTYIADAKAKLPGLIKQIVADSLKVGDGIRGITPTVEWKIKPGSDCPYLDVSLKIDRNMISLIETRSLELSLDHIDSEGSINRQWFVQDFRSFVPNAGKEMEAGNSAVPDPDPESEGISWRNRKGPSPRTNEEDVYETRQYHPRRDGNPYGDIGEM